jgi:methenyltetrahydrofolate cyclohydrolase
MLIENTVSTFMDELASGSPAPGGGSVAALSAAAGAALTSMVCNLTIGRKKYLGVEDEMKHTLEQSERLRKTFTALIDRDTAAFNKVMEALALPKETEAQKALRSAALEAATKEATLIPLQVLSHVVDALALTRIVAEKGNVNSASDVGVSTVMLLASAEGAAMNVRINLASIKDTEFVGWKAEETASFLRTSKMKTEEILEIVYNNISKG